MNQISEFKIISNHSRVLAIIFSVAVVILIFIGLSTFLPSANIVLQVNREPFVGEFQLKIDQSIKAPIYNLDIVPGLFYGFEKNWQEIDADQFVVLEELVDNVNKKILVCRRSDFNNFLSRELNLLAAGPKIIIDQDIQITDYKVESLDLESGRAVIKFFIKTEVVPDYNFESLSDFLADKPKFEAANYLKNLPNVQDVRINSWPAFVSKLPYLSRRIKIRLDII